jgi:hypothetical protein
MKQFNADEKAKEGGLEVIIGAKTFFAKEPTLAVMKQLAEAAPKSNPEEDKEKSESERMQEGIDSIFPQLEILLRDENGAPPVKDFIEEHLSMRRAGEMIQTLMGDDEANPH